MKERKSGFRVFQEKLYKYYLSVSNKPECKTFEEFIDMLSAYKERKDKYVVYFGYSKENKDHKKPDYVGTTIQFPIARWFYHKTHGNDLDFEVKFRFDKSDDMTGKEFEMIRKYHPKRNKITEREQNFNQKLTPEILESRKGDPHWCQCCYRRRVHPGYKYCYYCEREMRKN